MYDQPITYQLSGLAREYNLGPIQSVAQIHGGGRSEVYRVELKGLKYALRILHATISSEGIQYVHRVTEQFSRSVPEVPVMLLTNKGLPFTEAAGRLATLSSWLPGVTPAYGSLWLPQASAALLARLHRAAVDCSVKYPRPDRPSYLDLDWHKNYLFDIDTVRHILFSDKTSLRATSKPEDKEYVDFILSKRSFILQQHEYWSTWSGLLASYGRNLLKAPIHGDIYPANLLSEGERITAVIDWDECQYEPLVYELARVVWEFAKDTDRCELIKEIMGSFLTAYFKHGGPVSRADLDLMMPYICMTRIIEVLLYINNSISGDFWDARYTVQNLLALQNMQQCK